MSKINGNSMRMAKAKWIVAVLLMVTADALAQKQQPARQVLVSIHDRKLAVLEDDPRSTPAPGAAAGAAPLRTNSNRQPR